MPKIKFCGLKTAADITAANKLAPDYVGFVLAPRSKRRLTPEQAGELKKKLRTDIKAVGVFVDAPPEEIAELAEAKIIDLVQLHGREDETYIKHLRQRLNLPIIKAFIPGVSSREEIASSSADYVLIDSGQGSGETFDWDLAAQLKRPYFLAGGLSPENVSEAIKRLRPYAIDVSSGIETNARKDPAKMQAFIKAARNSAK